MQTLTVVTLVFGGQAVLYVARERRHLWASRPSGWLIASSIADPAIVGTLALAGLLMTALPTAVLAGLLAAAIAFAFILDAVKVALFHHLDIA